MGLTVVKRKPKTVKTKKPKKIFILGANGFDAFNSMANDDADILIQAKGIKSDSVRYENAKQAMKLRGY